MIIRSHCRKPPLASPRKRPGFTLVELLVVMAVIAIMASLILPALARAKARTQSVICLNNARQLTLACLIYATDHEDRLPYNLGGPDARTNLNNWAAGIQDWEMTPDNTNTALLIEAALGTFVSRSAGVYRCPSDFVLSPKQRAAGWQFRVRSYSMNGAVGDPGNRSSADDNPINPVYTQFLKLSALTRPTDIFVYLDEHPDSIHDGYFMNKTISAATAASSSLADTVADAQWTRLPATYHDGATSLSFADGHVESHHWKFSSTQQPAQPEAIQLPVPIPAAQTGDLAWLLDRTSIPQR